MRARKAKTDARDSTTTESLQWVVRANSILRNRVDGRVTRNKIQRRYLRVERHVGRRRPSIAGKRQRWNNENSISTEKLDSTLKDAFVFVHRQQHVVGWFQTMALSSTAIRRWETRERWRETTLIRPIGKGRRWRWIGTGTFVLERHAPRTNVVVVFYGLYCE